MTSTTVSPETFLVDPAHAVGEESDPFADLERRVSALEDLVTGGHAAPSVELRVEESVSMADYLDLDQQRADALIELQDLEAKHTTLLTVVDEIGRIVKKSTSKVSLEVKAAIDEWANPQTPSPAPGASQSEPQPEPIPAAGDEARAGEGSSGRIELPAHDADVEAWRAYAMSLGCADVDQLNRSQIRTMLGVEQPVAVE